MTQAQKELFGKRVQAIRKYLDLTGDQLGEKLDVKKAHLSNVENGKALLSTDKLFDLCETFHIDARWFFGGIDDIRDAFPNKDDVPTNANVLKELRFLRSRMEPPAQDDDIALKVQGNQEMRALVKMLFDESDEKIRLARMLIQSMLFGIESEKGEAGEERRA